ncbi:MAG: MOSC domain-containing protein [Rubrobacter sp.]|nr:MOSC domain-containing protein [Rubrobacter sp.]
MAQEAGRSRGAKTEIGRVAALWRYPVKSMLGEELEEAVFAERGLTGDRAYAVADVESGRIRNAKRAGWEGLFGFRADLTGEPYGDPSRLRITLPDGEVVAGEAGNRDEKLSGAFGRGATLVSGGAFFDLGAVHLLTTASLEKLGELYPEGSFDPRRFRPNVVLELGSGEVGFVEDGWLGRTLRLGDEIVLEVTEPVARCVMTTLPQAGLAKDPGIISTAYRHSGDNVGVYARVLEGGRVGRGDRVVLV